jgi:hypothetical protein
MPDIDLLKIDQATKDKYQIVDNTFKVAVKPDVKDLVEVEIGDSKTLDKFLPQQKVQRWQNECNVSVRLVHDEKTPEVIAEDGKIKWKGKDIEAHFYDFTNTDHPEGASEFEVILKEKPKTNVVEFTLQTKGLRFLYQPKIETPTGYIKLNDIADLVINQNFTNVVDIGGGTGEFVNQFNGTCIDNSDEAYAIRKTDKYIKSDIIKGVSTVTSKQFDFAIGIGFLKYISEKDVETTIKEIARISDRGLFTLGQGFQTFSDCPPIVNSNDSKWWLEKFSVYAPKYPVEIYNLVETYCPEDCEGSYAVYASENKPNYIDGKEYRVGKVGHIYRPKIIDSAGIWVWGELNIDESNGMLSVTIPQSFLDNATYPVKHAAGLTFGYTTAATNFDMSVGECIKASLYALGGAGTVTSISVANSTMYGTLLKFVLGIYDSDRNLLGQTNQDTTITDSFEAVNLQSPVEVSAGDYWLAREGDVEYLRYDNDAGATAMHDDLTYNTTLVDPLTADDGGRPTTRKYSIYATYTAAGSSSSSSSSSSSQSSSSSSSSQSSSSSSSSSSRSSSSSSSSQSSSSSSSSSGAAGSWLTGWDHRVKVTVLAAKVDEDITNFPIYVDLSALPAGFHTGVNQTDGRDIRVTKADGTTEVPREVVFYTAATDAGELHFKGDVLNATDVDFYIYYGNAGASEPAVDAADGPQQVWTNSFQAVYHMQQDPSGNGADAVKDSTSNTYHCTPYGAPALATGKLSGKAIAFGGVDEQLKDTNQVWADAQNACTVSMWSNFASADGAQSATIFRYTNAPSGKRFSAHAPWGNSTYFDFGTTSNGRINGDYTPYDDQYSLIHFQSNGSTYKSIYINGASRYSNGTTADNPDADLTGLAIGSGIDTEYHKGTIDEFRVATVVRSATWISTEYNNQNAPSTFFTIGAEEAPASSSSSSSSSSLSSSSSSSSFSSSSSSSSRSSSSSSSSLSSSSSSSSSSLSSSSSSSSFSSSSSSSSLSSSSSSSSFSSSSSSSSLSSSSSSSSLSSSSSSSSLSSSSSSSSLSSSSSSSSFSSSSSSSSLSSSSSSSSSSLSSSSSSSSSSLSSSSSSSSLSSSSSSSSFSSSSSSSSFSSSSSSSSLSSSSSSSSLSSSSSSSSLSSSSSSSSFSSSSSSSSFSSSSSSSSQSSSSSSSSLSSSSSSSSLSSSSSSSSLSSSSSSSSSSFSSSSSSSSSLSSSSSSSASSNTGKPLMVWDGSAWIKEPLKVYTGGSFQIKPAYFWSGSSWKEIDVNG